MGICNITPDSFSDGGRFLNMKNALIHIEQLIIDGADIIDIGGESSRPGSLRILEDEEWQRVGGIIKECKKRFPIPISLDTYKPEVARKALDIGVEIINDITGMIDFDLRKIVSEYDATVVIMHMKGDPKTMQKNPKYKDVILEIQDFLKQQIEICESEGVKKLIIDPGIGFGKSFEDNLKIMENLEKFSELGKPVLLGTSRKSFLGQLTGIKDPEKRDEATHETTKTGLRKGVSIFRVHDVRGTKKIIEKLRNKGQRGKGK